MLYKNYIVFFLLYFFSIVHRFILKKKCILLYEGATEWKLNNSHIRKSELRKVDDVRAVTRPVKPRQATLKRYVTS